MQKSTIDNVLFLGNHALSISQNIKNRAKLPFVFNSLNYKDGDPFEDDPRNLIQFNDINYSFNSEYELSSLKDFFAFFVKDELFFKTPALIIGNPSELLFQAFISALIEGDKNAVNSSIVVMLYPIGMIGNDTRKELSNLMYLLKTKNIQTLLIRNKEKKLDKALAFILNNFGTQSIYDLENQIEGFEHLIGKPKELLVENG